MDPERSESGKWIERLFEVHADEILDRDLRVRCDFDPRWQIVESERLASALIGLFRFAFSTVPDGCEIFVASARGVGPVERLESGSLTVRWQVAGAERSQPREKVTALRPVVGSAQTHIQSSAVVDLKGAFEAAGWDLELFAMADDREIRASASTR